MHKDTSVFLHRIYNCIRGFNGSIQEAYQFPHSPQTIQDLSACAPRLMHRKEANTYLFHIFEPLEYIYILLEGTCCVEKYNQGGKLFTDSTRDAMQIFGLIEAVTDDRYHTVSMKCFTDCTYAKIPVASYMKIIQSDPELLMMSMRFVCIFFREHVQTTDQLMLGAPRRSILLKLYHYCAERPFPVTVQIQKKELAQDLNMNLRTLYRHLDKFYEEGILSAHKGKIWISRKQYLEIGAELMDLDK